MNYDLCMTRHFITFSFCFRGLTDTRFDLHSSLGLLNRKRQKRTEFSLTESPRALMTITIGTYLSAFWRNKYDFISRCVSSFTIPSALVLSNSSLLSPLPRSSRMEEKFDIFYFYFQRVREKLIFNLSYTCSRFSRFCCFASHFLLLFFLLCFFVPHTKSLGSLDRFC